MSSQKMNWTMEQDETLIDFVRNHEAIYNVTCKEYRKTQMKHNSWREIGGILNKTDVDCSKRWSYIRDYYIRRRGKPGTGSSGEAAQKRSDLLSFLDNCSSTKRRYIASVASSDEHNEENISETKVDVTDEDTMATEVVQANFTPTMEKSCSPISKKFKTSTHSEEQIQLLEAIAQRQTQPEKKDETDLFFSAMSEVVKKLPQYERAQLRMQITTLVSNAELRHLASQGEYPTAAASTGGCNTNNQYLGGICSPGSSESNRPPSNDNADHAPTLLLNTRQITIGKKKQRKTSKTVE